MDGRRYLPPPLAGRVEALREEMGIRAEEQLVRGTQVQALLEGVVHAPHTQEGDGQSEVEVDLYADAHTRECPPIRLFVHGL